MNSPIRLVEHKVDRLWREFKEAHKLAATSASPADAIYAARAFGAVLTELNALGEAGRQAFLRRVSMGSTVLA